LVNRRIRDPYVRWCERRTPLNFGRSRLLDYLTIVYDKDSIIAFGLFSAIFKKTFADP